MATVLSKIEKSQKSMVKNASSKEPNILYSKIIKTVCVTET